MAELELSDAAVDVALDGPEPRGGLAHQPLEGGKVHLGVAERVGEVEVWQASFDLADRQRLVCTPWFDLAAGAFV